MGVFAQLKISNAPVLFMENQVHPDLLQLFTPAEREENAVPFPGQDPALKEQDLEKVHTYEYRSTAGFLCDRLDVIGFTLARVQKVFATFKRRRRSYLPVLQFEAWQRHIDYLTQHGLTSWNLKTPANLQRCPAEQLKDWDQQGYPELDELLSPKQTNTHLGFPIEDYDPRYCWRALLSSVSRNSEVVLDYSELVNAGYYETADLFAEHQPSPHEQFAVQTTILTEGPTDRQVIKNSLRCRYPHLAHLYQFLDFHGNASTARELGNLVKAFAACRLEGRFIAIFDSDTAGLETHQELLQLELPGNIKVLTLPPLELASRYPTFGPMGELAEMDVNNLACGLEMYLGETVLRGRSGQLAKVHWTGYNKRMKRYQGELLDKAWLREVFLVAVERDPEAIDWTGIDSILKAIFDAFN
ncbi:MAG: hypothetical protein KF760_19500 [Candidatus Eremiobacteraeota bacterium]|nr:hypothetical protein [Candidatus Eremiobacteraeota bacterium]MCW5868756.1 hypothetical protein [Candidatus Eremiobacteraeota bacterium]